MSARKVDWTKVLLAVILVVLGFLAARRGGSEMLWQGLMSGGSTILEVIPLLIAAFLVAGLTQVLIGREQVERWLGRRSGWRGILLACLGGSLIPGGPYVYYPIAAALLKSGAGLGVLIAFISAKNLWSVTRLPFEFSLLGPQLTLVRFALTFILPPLLGWLADLIFGHQLDRIRELAP